MQNYPMSPTMGATAWNNYQMKKGKRKRKQNTTFFCFSCFKNEKLLSNKHLIHYSNQVIFFSYPHFF